MRANKYSQVAYRSRVAATDSTSGAAGSQSPVRFLPLYLILIIASLGIIALDVRYGFEWFNHFVGRVANPLVLTLDRVISPLSSSFSYVHETLEAREQNADLRNRLTELERENLSLKDAAVENERLRELLNLKANIAPSAMAAPVVRYVDQPGKCQMVLRAGEDQGLQVGQPVLSDTNQLLGRIIATSPTTSTVRLIRDPISKVRVTLERTGAQGTLYSQTGNLYLRLERGENIRAGDRIVTSHLSQSFPEGLAIGEVSRTASDPESDPMVAVEMGLTKNYAIDPIIPVSDWGSFREVLCLPGSHQTILEKWTED